MRLADLQLCRTELIRVRFVDGPVEEAVLADSPLELRFPGAGEPLVGPTGDLRAIEPVGASDAKGLGRVEDGGRPAVCWALVEGAQDGRLIEQTALQVHEFASEIVWSEPLQLGVNDELVEKMRRAKSIGAVSGVDAVVRQLTERLLVPRPDGGSLAFATTPRSQALADAPTFSLHGRVSAAVSREPDGRLVISSVTPPRRAANTEPVTLMRGSMAFVDATQAAAIRGVARAELDAIVAQGDSYLGVWGGYQSVEEGLLLARSQALGTVAYSHRTELAAGGWRFHMSRTAAQVADWGREEDLQLAASVDPPGSRRSSGSADRDVARRSARVEYVGELHGVDSGGAWVDLRSSGRGRASEPPPRGWLSASVVGDRVRLERRTLAREAIAAAETPMPRLGLLMEGRAVPVTTRRRQTAIPARVRAKFPNGPTERQEEALRVAYNTPDIALIQGPPGTGKTDLIAALETWLAETAEDTLSGQVLLSSYQHDAVDNAVSRSTVLDLPARRVGGNDQRAEAGRAVIDRWIDNLATAVRADSAERVDARVATAARAVEARVRAYELSPGDTRATAALLEDVADVGAEILPARLASRLTTRASELRRAAEPDFANVADNGWLESVVRALRTTEAAYADDGRRTAGLLAAQLASEAAPQHDPAIALLRGLGESPRAELLRELGDIKGRLLDGLRALKEPASPAPTHDAEARRLLQAAVQAAGEARSREMGGVGRALERYADSLEADRPRAEATLARYTTVLAATCQQSVAGQMREYKPEGLQFETVIVDEAARANPLDLMIPLALARRRIVLVGDQAQLPHILEPEVEHELDGDVAEETRQQLRESLFARLFENLRAREARGEPARVVTLDTQFRMHPMLGDFVSRAFYEPDTVLRSGRPAGDFPHHLSRFGDAVAAWVDLPNERGNERGRQSKERAVEADWIAEALPDLMEQEPNLSFGVITPYARQCTTVLRALAQVGLAHVTDAGDVHIAPKWVAGLDAAGRAIERLRVGTVDAFQGMEFDVVILSVTRSSPPPAVSSEEALRRRYGHLMLANRLCVAMSRQRRLLVAVGDPVMVSGADAEIAVPSLVEFRRLCEGEHGAVLVG